MCTSFWVLASQGTVVFGLKQLGFSAHQKKKKKKSYGGLVEGLRQHKGEVTEARRPGLVASTIPVHHDYAILPHQRCEVELEDMTILYCLPEFRPTCSAVQPDGVISYQGWLEGCLD